MLVGLRTWSRQERAGKVREARYMQDSPAVSADGLPKPNSTESIAHAKYRTPPGMSVLYCPLAHERWISLPDTFSNAAGRPKGLHPTQLRSRPYYDLAASPPRPS